MTHKAGDTVNGEVRCFSDREEVVLFTFLLTAFALPFIILALTH